MAVPIHLISPKVGESYTTSVDTTKRASGKTHKEAMRCLKRRLADVVYRTMIRDTETSLLPTP